MLFSFDTSFHFRQQPKKDISKTQFLLDERSIENGKWKTCLTGRQVVNGGGINDYKI